MPTLLHTKLCVGDKIHACRTLSNALGRDEGYGCSADAGGGTNVLEPSVDTREHVQEAKSRDNVCR
jgi:hypothetical protein